VRSKTVVLSSLLPSKYKPVFFILVIQPAFIAGLFFALLKARQLVKKQHLLPEKVLFIENSLKNQKKMESC